MLTQGTQVRCWYNDVSKRRRRESGHAYKRRRESGHAYKRRRESGHAYKKRRAQSAEREGVLLRV
jgi:hypothetical protein